MLAGCITSAPYIAFSDEKLKQKDIVVFKISEDKVENGKLHSFSRFEGLSDDEEKIDIDLYEKDTQEIHVKPGTYTLVAICELKTDTGNYHGWVSITIKANKGNIYELDCKYAKGQDNVGLYGKKAYLTVDKNYSYNDK